MKKITFLLTAIFMSLMSMAQAPQGINYQAVARTADGDVVVDQNIIVKISILSGSASGTAIYSERHDVTTNSMGLFTLQIGNPTQVLSGTFETINWGAANHFLKTEIDENGGSNFALLGTSQLLSVPYALHSATTESFDETDPSVPSGSQLGEMQYWNGSAWVTVTPGFDGAVLTLDGGVPVWVGGEPQIQTVTNPVTGEIWMDRNLGASQVATSSTDEAAYGYLFQWGRADDGHENRTSGTTTTLSNSDDPGHDDYILNGSGNFYDWRSPQNHGLWQGESGINNPCPSGFRLPTEAEWIAEVQTWSSNNLEGAFDSQLKLTAAGRRYPVDGSLTEVESYGFYWSSNTDGNRSRLQVNSTNSAGMGSDYRAYGFSVRCIKD